MCRKSNLDPNSIKTMLKPLQKMEETEIQNKNKIQNKSPIESSNFDLCLLQMRLTEFVCGENNRLPDYLLRWEIDK
jgi:hypothetical protein